MERQSGSRGGTLTVHEVQGIAPSHGPAAHIIVVVIAKACRPCASPVLSGGGLLCTRRFHHLGRTGRRREEVLRM